MGMSASQMRYCMLTGRKSDVEFQGQQINQQRTTLATETAAYNNQLLELTVPTPPSSSSYVTTTYSYTSGGNTYTITGTQYDSSTGTYTINSTYAVTGDEATSGLGTYYSTTTNGATSYYTGSSSTPTTLTAVDLSSEDTTTSAQDASNLSTIFGSNYSTTAGSYYKYTVDGTSRYITSTELSSVANTGTQGTYYYVNSDADLTQSSVLKGASVTWSSSGRMETITDSSGTEYSLSVTSTSDDAAYEDAYNEYEYQQSVYQQSIEKINSQVDVIESEDKKLELKLTDLDTQQQALSTEMESVKKVVDKNIETSFKAFSA